MRIAYSKRVAYRHQRNEPAVDDAAGRFSLTPGDLEIHGCIESNRTYSNAGHILGMSKRGTSTS